MLNDNPQEFANELVVKAFYVGINYFDVTPKYGNAEPHLGPTLTPYRRNTFLACKTRQRNAAGAQKDLESSLRKLQTDYFDLHQLHELTTDEEVKTVFGKNGALEALIKAKRDGKIKHIGFSAHSINAALFALKNFDLDSILSPLILPAEMPATWNHKTGNRKCKSKKEKEPPIK